MKLYYHTGPAPGNFGDILNKWLVEQISGKDVEVAKPGRGVYACIGSIIKFTVADMRVWGTGAMRMTDQCSAAAKYFAVRGPLTRHVVLRSRGDCPPIYGDPALLLSKYYRPQIKKVHRLGIIPHYIDYEATKARYPDHMVINLLNENPLEVVDQILACEETVSSSLHGLIVSHAYGIPSGYISTLEGKLNGDGTKFKDYFMSVGLPTHDPYDPENLDAAHKYSDIQFDSEALLAACPFYRPPMPRIVSFYTKDYEDHAKRLRSELVQLDLRHTLVEFEPIGEWIDNTRLKGRLVADALKGGPVLWMDVDSSIHQLPKFFSGLDADFAGFPKTNPDRPWAVGHLWFNNTPKGRELAEKWATECENAPLGVSDEWALARAWKAVNGVKAAPLPRSYFDYTVNQDTVLSIRLSGNASKYIKTNASSLSLF